MTHLPPLIQDLGFLLLTGGLVALLFSFLRQPLIVGYLLAGFLIGPNFRYFPHVTEADGIRLWGEIGVLFLLFSLGLEFSFKKLVSMGPASLVAASIEVVGLVALGTWVAGLLQFDANASLFFGAMLAISRRICEFGNRSFWISSGNPISFVSRSFSASSSVTSFCDEVSSPSLF